ncbi:DUF3500 domain-containing protein [Runella sp.]|uniref:DUF3500 domain-containing protein n=1 Tax=Runella sp. TaxID=1960881 RepID=UPI003D0E3E08
MQTYFLSPRIISNGSKTASTLFFLLLWLQSGFAQKSIGNDLKKASEEFLATLSVEQKGVANLPFDSEWRYDWNYTPRQRKGLPLKQMNDAQRKAAMTLVKLSLSEKGIEKAESIIGLEYVLRQVEKRPENDTYRDPENYAFAIFGTPDAKQPWAWSVEGHHLSLHFTIVDNKVEFLPSFFGSNPGIVLPGYIQEGKQVLKEEADIAFQLLGSFDEQQLKKVMLSEKAPNDMLTTNTKKAGFEKQEGLAWGDMTAAQQKIFQELLNVYLNKYHVTLKNQELARLRQADINKIYFAWMGDREPLRGAGHGHYFRVHGPTFLIEYDNTQNGANHVHSVVRDLTDDWGEDLLKAHYAASHVKK